MSLTLETMQQEILQAVRRTGFVTLTYSSRRPLIAVNLVKAKLVD